MGRRTRDPSANPDPWPPMSEQEDFRCARCESPEGPPLGNPPFRNEIGQRVAREICRGCFEDWKQRQMLLINHYALNLRDRKARQFLMENMEAFLFGEGEGARIDTGKEGTVGADGVQEGSPAGSGGVDDTGDPTAGDPSDDRGGAAPGSGGPAGPPPG